MVLLFAWSTYTTGAESTHREKKSEIYLHFLFYEQTDYPESSGISEVLAYYILFNVLFTHYFPIPVANM